MGSMMAPARIRIGIDTGRTFTDLVARDEDTGRLVSVTTRSTPGAPAQGFPAVTGKAVLPFFDWHPGYAGLPGWAACADADLLECPGLTGERTAAGRAGARPLPALAGPHAAMMLGDLRARAIKLGNPDGGDDCRAWGPHLWDRRAHASRRTCCHATGTRSR